MTDLPAKFYCDVTTYLTPRPQWVETYGCLCGQRGCSDVWLHNLGEYMQGSGFDRPTAERLADTWNAAELLKFRQAVVDNDPYRDGVALENAYNDRDEARRVFEKVHAAYGVFV